MGKKSVRLLDTSVCRHNEGKSGNYGQSIPLDKYACAKMSKEYDRNMEHVQINQNKILFFLLKRRDNVQIGIQHTASLLLWGCISACSTSNAGLIACSHPDIFFREGFTDFSELVLHPFEQNWPFHSYCEISIPRSQIHS